MNDGTQTSTVCARCDTEFTFDAPHTELTRRDFVDTPQPARIEYLCLDCWRVYVEEFLGAEFEA